MTDVVDSLQQTRLRVGSVEMGSGVPEQCLTGGGQASPL